MKDAIQIHGLKKSFLKGLDLQIKKGEIFALLGVNGAGKTTTLECIEGLRKYDSGTITVNGKMGIQLQSSSLPAHIRPMEAVKLFAKWNKTKIDDAMLDGLGIKEMEKTQYIQLSTGQKRRLHLALALIGDPGCISPLRLSAILILFFLMSRLRDWMSKADYRSTNRSVSSDASEKQSSWQVTTWRKWKPYVTALPF